MTFPFGAKADFHFVIIHGMCRIAFCHKDGFSSFVRNEKVLSVTFPLEGSCENLTFIVKLVASFFCFNEEIILCHFFDDFCAKHLQWMSGEFQPLEQLLEID